MTGFETSVRIRRPIEEVFAFVADPLNLRHWNSAVRAVWKTRGQESEAGSTYTMERDLPGGRAQNELEIFAREQPAQFGIRTTSGPTPFSYRYGFTSHGGETVVALHGAFELDGQARPARASRRPGRQAGSGRQPRRLKHILETPPRPA